MSVCLNSKVKELHDYTAALIDHCDKRGKGQDCRGNNKGAMNHRLTLSMLDIKEAGDLRRLKQTGHVDHLKSVHRSIKSLVEQRFIPQSANVDMGSLTAVYKALRASSGSTNQELFKFLHKGAKDQTVLKPYLDLITRLWLLCPPESVVESMASVVEDVFGQHRQLNHENAELELMIRWNGPDVHHADDLLSAVQKSYTNTFVRKTESITTSLAGSVFRKHVVDRKCRRASVFRQ